MYEFRGMYITTIGIKYVEYTCVVCSAQSKNLPIIHTEDCNYLGEQLASKYFREKIDKIIDDNWELNSGNRYF